MAVGNQKGTPQLWRSMPSRPIATPSRPVAPPFFAPFGPKGTPGPGPGLEQIFGAEREVGAGFWKKNPERSQHLFGGKNTICGVKTIVWEMFVWA